MLKFFLLNYLLVLILFAIGISSCNLPKPNNQALSLENEHRKSLTVKAENYLVTHPDSALIIADSALKLFNKSGIKDTSSQYQLYQIKANAWQNMEQSDSALLWLQKKYDLSLTSSDSMMQARSLFNLLRYQIENHRIANPSDQINELAALFQRLGMEYESAKALLLYDDWCNQTGDVLLAQKYLIEACRIYENLDSTAALSAVFINIGNNFKQMGSKTNALRYYRKSATISKMENDTLNLAKALINEGTIYRTQNTDSAIICYEEVSNLLSGTHYSYTKIINSFNLASIYLDKKSFDKARNLLEQVMKLSKESNNREALAYAHNGLAALFSKTGKLDLAIANMEASVKIADSLKNKIMLLQLKKQLFNVYKEAGRWKDATLMVDSINVLNDSILSFEKQVTIHQLEIAYESQKKELENAHLLEKVHTQEHILSLRQAMIIMLSLGLTILTVLLWFTFRLYKQRRYAYQALLGNYKKEMAQSQQMIQYYNSKQDADSTINEPIADSDQLMERLLEYFDAEKPFLDSKIKVDEVALKLNTSRKAISQALKQYQNINFNTFCNLYRVEEAKKLLTNPAFDKHKIEAIGMDAGFGSRQSFYAVFQQITGMLPSYFRENLRSEGMKKV